MNPAPLLVLAPTGKTGRRVLARLQESGAVARARSRGTTPAFDWHEPATWEGALAGVRAAYVAYSPDLAVPGAAEVVAHFARRARAHGLERLVLLSGRGEPAAQRAEAEVRAVLPASTVLRSAWFVQNLTEGDFAPAVDAGVLALPVGEVPEPFVDCDDVADIAAAALLDTVGGPHAGATYEVTGPRSLTFAELAAAAGAAFGWPVRYAQLSAQEAVTAWRAAGVPEEAVALLDALFAELFDGRNAVPGDGVQRALGRPARDVQVHLSAGAAAGTAAR